MTTNEGWQFCDTNSAEWQTTPDGTRYKMIGVADGFGFVLSELQPGYQGTPHHHEAPEFLYVLDGSVLSNGVEMKTGHGYTASTGSEHLEFVSDHGCRFISVFKLR